MNYLKKPGFNLYQSWHCAYKTYSVKTWFLKFSLYYNYFQERSVDEVIIVSSLIQRNKASV